jgi:hypothetical protein
MWGFGGAWQLGNGSTASSKQPVAAQLPAGIAITSVRAGCFHTLALTSAGQVLAWGANDDGQLGTGTLRSSTTPVAVSLPPATTVKAIRAGCLYSLALTTAGQVLAWGDNEFGELGTGSPLGTSRVPVPLSLPPGTTVKSVSAGDEHGLALTTTGQVLAWGDNDFGQLGNGTRASSNVPVPVMLPAGTTVTGLAATQGDSLALTSGGKVLAWGDNAFGQLGSGSAVRDSTTPVRVALPTGTAVRSLYGGGTHVLALTSKGKLLAWGNNKSGQLGDGTTTGRRRPVTVKLPTGTVVKAITAGDSHSLALTGGGQVLAWGANADGELGNGTFTGSKVPVQVTLPTTPSVTVGSIAAGPTAQVSAAVVTFLL